MSSPFSSDLAGIRDDARRMVERFGDLARAQTDAGELQQRRRQHDNRALHDHVAMAYVSQLVRQHRLELRRSCR